MYSKFLEGTELIAVLLDTKQKMASCCLHLLPIIRQQVTEQRGLFSHKCLLLVKWNQFWFTKLTEVTCVPNETLHLQIAMKLMVLLRSLLVLLPRYGLGCIVGLER